MEPGTGLNIVLGDHSVHLWLPPWLQLILLIATVWVVAGWLGERLVLRRRASLEPEGTVSPNATSVGVSDATPFGPAYGQTIAPPPVHKERIKPAPGDPHVLEIEAAPPQTPEYP